MTRRTATPLSQLALQPLEPGRQSALARRSQGRLVMLLALGLSSSLFGTGCLVADAPEYGPPQRTPPVIDTLSVTPSLFAVQPITMNNPSLLLNVPLRSEDAGDPIQGSLWLDYTSADPKPFEEHTLPPSTFDTERNYTTPWVPDERVGKGKCHTLTLLLMHRSSYDDISNLPIPKKSEGDVVSVTWWVNVLPKDQNVLLNCPTPSETMQ